MSATLQLQIEHPSTRSRSGHGVVVTVRQVSGADGLYPDHPFEKSVLVDGGGSQGRKLVVPDGRYRLEARLPNGRILRESRTVVSGTHELVRFNITGTPHEWLAWQTVSGNIPPINVYEERRRELSILERRPPSTDLAQTNLAFELQGFGRTEGPPEREQFRVPLQFLSVNATMIGLAAYAELLPHVEEQQDEQVTLWSTNFANMEADWQIREDVAFPPSRAAAIVGTKFTTLLAFLPVPWIDRNGGLASIELLYDRSIANDRGFRISVIDSDRGPLLSYLGSSRMFEAAVAFSTDPLAAKVLIAMEMKRQNPLAAAAAAYVGLSFPPGEMGRDTWSPWLANLMNWFPAIPDGAILFARDRIERARNEEDLKAALFALVAAFKRGPPYFSAGVRHLLDGLSRFLKTAELYGFPKEEVAKMHMATSNLALLTDPNQAFTVLKLPAEFLNV